ncbi:hypothetical protein [Runella salmonicolor]|uniref:Uncharacterized protein n=1 Tax=Runella salmonicolor TaxID=2950278 RepID=A0ABT1FRS5_9BACT|nr:hypothetical protein [Runella salmonicolor]MCP1384471.1 hypothetical protein [Runella salmonicolor]
MNYDEVIEQAHEEHFMWQDQTRAERDEWINMSANVSGLCIRAGNRSTKAGFITKVHLKNHLLNFTL